MKKALYMILLIAEFVVGFGWLVLTTALTGWTYFVIVAAVWAAVMIWLCAKVKKVTSEKGKRKSKVAIALFMLFPLVAGIIGFAWVVSTVSW